MKKNIILITTCLIMLCGTNIYSQEEKSTEKEKSEYLDLFDLTIEQILGIDPLEKGLKIYGYFNTNIEKVLNEPYIDETGSTAYESSPAEWTTPSFHLYGSTRINDNIDLLFNLGNNGDIIDIRNAWGNIRINNYIQLRFGKIYRKFGLFNEKLDQLPTFYGIEPPELFDGDHLMLPRTTTFVIHGKAYAGSNVFEYSLNTGNGEGVGNFSVVPLGFDLRYKTSNMKIGTSFYISSINSNRAVSTVGVGEGSPSAGILPWMVGDDYYVTGGYLEKTIGRLHIKTAFWSANHDAERDPDAVIMILNNAELSQKQKENFFGTMASLPDTALTSDDVITDAKYKVQTFYIRLGYEIPTSIGQILPYVFVDWMNHPETIKSKEWGGDNEAGISDDGKFLKPSIGMVFKPNENVAIKLDASTHHQKFNGKDEFYPEIRLDVSFAFK